MMQILRGCLVRNARSIEDAVPVLFRIVDGLRESLKDFESSDEVDRLRMWNLCAEIDERMPFIEEDMESDPWYFTTGKAFVDYEWFHAILSEFAEEGWFFGANGNDIGFWPQEESSPRTC
jgi:hypothetical protein